MIHRAQAAEGELPSAILTDTFKGYQSTEGYRTMADGLADVINFSGFPDRTEITVLTFPVIVELTDEQGRERPEVRIEAGGTWATDLRAKKVRARNATAGSNGLIQVVGKWLCSSESPYALRTDH